MMHRMTTLGLNERQERVLAYMFGWVSGLLLFLLEKIAMCAGMQYSQWSFLAPCSCLL